MTVHRTLPVTVEFAKASAKWRRKPLTGYHAHYCCEWDDLPVDETCDEWPCGCEDDLDKEFFHLEFVHLGGYW